MNSHGLKLILKVQIEIHTGKQYDPVIPSKSLKSKYTYKQFATGYDRA